MVEQVDKDKLSPFSIFQRTYEEICVTVGYRWMIRKDVTIDLLD